MGDGIGLVRAIGCHDQGIMIAAIGKRETPMPDKDQWLLANPYPSALINPGIAWLDYPSDGI
jgi:hypothetical protein